ncbi:MAG: hypothetical protein ABEH77_02840 [Halobacteriaceae archaeon]
MAVLFFGFVFAAVGYGGWQDPRGMARISSWAMRNAETEADEKRQRGYGRLLAGMSGLVGVALIGYGLYAFLTNLLA